MDWFVFLLLVALILLFLCLPGLMLLTIAGIRDYRAILLSPTVGIGTLAVTTFVGTIFGGWSWLYPIVLIAVLGLVAIYVWRKQTEPKQSFLIGPMAVQMTYAALGVLAFWATYLPFILKYWDGPASPQSYGDAGFHSQGTLLVATSGNVNPFGALGPIFDPINPGSTYYPTLWHAITSLFVSFVPVAEASNALIVVVGLIIWPLSLSVLALATFPQWRSVALWAPLLGSMAPAFPGEILFRNATNGFGLSVPLVPAALAVIVWFIRSQKSEVESRLGWVGLFIVITLGSIAAQPTTALLILVGPFAALVVYLLHVSWQSLRAGNYIGPIFTVAGISAFVLLVLWYAPRNAYVLRLASFERVDLGYTQAILRLLEGGPTYGVEVSSYMPWLLIAVLALIGSAFAVFQGRASQTVLLTAGILLLIYLAAAGPEGRFRILTGPWYKDFTRLSIFVVMAMSVLAAGALGALISYVQTRKAHPRYFPIIAILLVVVTLVAASRINYKGAPLSPDKYVETGYSVDPSVGNVLTEDSREVLRNLSSEIPAGKYILGTPGSGAEFVPATSDAFSFIPLNPPRTPEQKYVVQNINNIEQDPMVCDIINDANIYAVMTTDAPPTPSDHESYLGLYDLDTEQGFELLDRRGDIALWKITACD